MKLKFKRQDYQTQAVAAVADCFKEQRPSSSGIQYRIDPGKVKAGGQNSLLEYEGFKNPDVMLNPIQLLTNIQTVQRHQNLPVSDALVSNKISPINLDIEMETGTGKTYCYIKTMFELNKRYRCFL